MATNTNNYGFKKPEENDFYSIEDQNRNWDLADTKMAQLNSDLIAKFANIGTVTYGNVITLQTTSSWTANASIILAPGVYLIDAQISINGAGNTTSVRLNAPGEIGRQSVYASDGNWYNAHLTQIIKVTENTTVTAYTWSPKTFNMGAVYLKATRITT